MRKIKKGHKKQLEADTEDYMKNKKRDYLESRYYDDSEEKTY